MFRELRRCSMPTLSLKLLLELRYMLDRLIHSIFRMFVPQIMQVLEMGFGSFYHYQRLPIDALDGLFHRIDLVGLTEDSAEFLTATLIKV